MAFGWQAGCAVAIVVVANLLCYLLNSGSVLWRGRSCAHVNLVFVSNRRGAREQRPQTWFAWDLVDSKHVVTGPIGAPALTLFRAFEVVVFAFTVAYGNILYEPAGGSFFIYFTNWTFVAFGLTGLLGMSLTAREWSRSRRPTLPCIETHKPPATAPGWHPLLRCYHLLLTTTCSASIMLTIFYWFADYVPGSSLRFDNPVKHGASSLLLLADVALSRVPLVSYHLQVVVAYGSTYLTFMWIYHASSGTWVYRALDWTRPLSVGFYAALPLLLALGFAVMSVVACVRELLLRKCSGCCGRRTSSGNGGSSGHHRAEEQLVTAPGLSGGKAAASLGSVPSLVGVEGSTASALAGGPRLQLQQHHSTGSVLQLAAPPSPRVAITLR